MMPLKNIAALAGLWLLRLALSGIFLYAGALKLRDARSFAESIAAFRLLPEVLVSLAALTLPFLEIGAAILALGNGWRRRIGAFGLLAMLAVFLAALASAQARGLNVDCGCFGVSQLDVLTPSKNLWAAIARDSVMAAAAWVAYLDARARQT